MVIYNVTINVEESIHEEWLSWMKSKHLKDVMNTGIFNEYKIFKLLSRQEDETGFTYAIQYQCDSLEKYEIYRRDFAPALQQDTQAKYGGKFVAFRTLLEEV
jgi:hypothetical protein